MYKINLPLVVKIKQLVTIDALVTNKKLKIIEILKISLS